jgi:hypothetical protein
MKVLGILLLVSCAGAYALLYVARSAVLRSESVVVAIAAVILPLLGAKLGLALWRLGRRIDAATAIEVLEADPRAPVLLLRPFSEDDRAPSPLVRVAGAFSNFIPDATLEERLVAEFRSLGPVVAVGKPGERLSPSGAARLYLSNEEWKSRVAELATRARMVLLVVGGTSGIRWELEHLPSCTSPDRVLLCVPGTNAAERSRSYAAFRAVLPPDRAHCFPESCSAALVAFDSAWNAVPLEGGPADTVLPLPAAAVATARMRLRLGSRSRPSPFRILLYLVPVAIVLLVAYFGLDARMRQERIGASARAAAFVAIVALSALVIGGSIAWATWRARAREGRRTLSRTFVLGAAAIGAVLLVGSIARKWLLLPQPPVIAPGAAEAERARAAFVEGRYEEASEASRAAIEAGLWSPAATFVAAQADRARERASRGLPPVAPLASGRFSELVDVRLTERRVALHLADPLQEDLWETIHPIAGLRRPRVHSRLLLWDLDDGVQAGAFGDIVGLSAHAAARRVSTQGGTHFERVDLATGESRPLEPEVPRGAWAIVAPELRARARAGRHLVAGTDHLPEYAWDLEGAPVAVRLAAPPVDCDGTWAHFEHPGTPPELWSLCHRDVRALPPAVVREASRSDEFLPRGSWRVVALAVWSLADGALLRAERFDVGGEDASRKWRELYTSEPRISTGELQLGGASFKTPRDPILILGDPAEPMVPVVVGNDVHVYEAREFDDRILGRVRDAAGPSRTGNILFLPGIRGNETDAPMAALFDLSTRELLLMASRAERSAFAPDGLLVAAAAPGVVEVWSVRGRLLLRATTPDLEGSIHEVAFSPDGSRLLVVSQRGATLWDVHRTLR